ncbi:MAG: hypothetical protein M3018_15025 [Actinomycetota bacterium]|nr:hypothetical protein [Actinomycetota bacterium]
MKRTSLVRVGALTLAILAVAAAPSFAAIIELGQTKTPLVAPICPPGVTPKNCTIILPQVTALETLRDGKGYPTTVKQPGYIVAFTVGLSMLSSNRATERADIKSLDKAFGGTTRLGNVVLKPIGRHRKFQWKAVAASPIFHVQPYLGQVVQFALPTALRVQTGYTIALTVPTWAPVLSINLSTKMFAYRQSRSTGCALPPTTPSAQSLGQTAAYKCNYPGTRVEYSVTEVTDPVAINPIH